LSFVEEKHREENTQAQLGAQKHCAKPLRRTWLLWQVSDSFLNTEQCKIQQRDWTL